MKIINLPAAALSVMLSALSVGQASAEGNTVFAGISAANSATFGYLGGIHAMNGDLSKNGLLMRGMIIYGEYDYKTTAVVGGKVDADAVGVELGVGYQWVNPGSRFSIYGGIDHQNHDLSPNDILNSVRGSTTGAALQAEIETLGSPWYGSLIGKLSSANDTYWVRGRGGYTFGSLTIGPEVIRSGNDEYRETRLGLFLNVPVSKSSALSLSAGHRNSKGDNALHRQSGGYLGANFAVQF